MDIRKFFQKSPAPPTTTTSTPHQQPKPSAPRPQTRPIILTDSDEDEFVVSGSAKSTAQTRVQLPPPKPLTRPTAFDSSNPSKSDRSANKRGRKPTDAAYSHTSESSSESSSGQSDLSGSDNDFDDAPKKSSRVKPAPKQAPKVHNTAFIATDSEDEAPVKTKKPTAALKAKTTPTKAAPKKASKPVTNDSANDDNDDDDDQAAAVKKPRAPRKKATKGAAEDNVDYDFTDILLEDLPTLAPKDPDNKTSAMGIDPNTGRSVPKWILAKQGALIAAPPPLHGLRPQPRGARNCLASGGGGPNGKNRAEKPFTFVLTGTLKSLQREECEDLIKSLGGKVTGQPSGKTDFLVYGTEGSESKLRKAMDNGTNIIDEDGLFKLIIKKSPGIAQPFGLFEDDQMGLDLQPQPSPTPPSSNSRPTTTTTTSTAPPMGGNLGSMMATQPSIPAAAKGTLHARKAAAQAAAAAAATTTTTVTTTTTINTQSPSSTQSTQPISSPPASLPTTSSTSLSTPKPSLYARKSNSANTPSTVITPAAQTTTPLSPDQREPIQYVTILNPPVIPNFPGTTEHDLWVDRFKPNSARDICGNNTIVEYIIDWLKMWHIYLKEDQFEGGANATKKKSPSNSGPAGADGPPKKAILLAGGPGIGKTTAAVLCAKEVGLQPIEFNASDTRSKNSIRDEVGAVSGNKTLSQFFGTKVVKRDEEGNKSTTYTRPTPKRGNGSVIIMDEVDGVTASDRGGVAELIKIIKESTTPIICICNDAGSDKIKSLKNHCQVFTWQRPRATQVTKRLQQICLSQGMQVDDSAMEGIFSQTNGDLRQTLNYLQMLHSTRKGTLITYNDTKTQRSTGSKDIEKDPFAVCPSFFRFGNGEGWFNEYMNNVYVSQDLFPLFIYENYLKSRANGGFGTTNRVERARLEAKWAKTGFQPPKVPVPKDKFAPKLLSTSNKGFPASMNDITTTTTTATTTTTLYKKSPSLIVDTSNLAPFNPSQAAAAATTTISQSTNAARIMFSVSSAIDAQSEAQLHANAIFEEQQFSLWSYNSALGVVYPGQCMSGGLTGKIDFPYVLGKFSSIGKSIRVSTLLRNILSPISQPLSRDEFQLQYLPVLYIKFIALMLEKASFATQDQLRQLYGEEFVRMHHQCIATFTGIECMAFLLAHLHINKDDFDLLIEQCDNLVAYAHNIKHTITNPPALKDASKPPTWSNLIPTADKSKLTRVLNKLIEKGGRMKRLGGATDSPKPLTEEQLLEFANHEVEEDDDDGDDDEEEENADNDNSKTPTPAIPTPTVATKGKAGASAVKKQRLG